MESGKFQEKNRKRKKTFKLNKKLKKSKIKQTKREGKRETLKMNDIKICAH